MKTYPKDWYAVEGQLFAELHGERVCVFRGICWMGPGKENAVRASEVAAERGWVIAKIRRLPEK